MNNLSADAKDALARDVPRNAHCREALLTGLARYGRRGKRGEYFSTRRNAIARLFHSLSEKGGARDAAHRYRMPIDPALPKRKPLRKCDRVMEARAAFLACGSLSGGAQGYHLEFVPPAGSGERLGEILRAIADPPKQMRRGARAVLYYKDFESIVRFLGVAGAHRAVLQLEELHAVKETKNRIHRLVNTEAANLERVAGAAASQRQTIEFLRSAHGLNHLSHPLREIAELRLSFPDESLSELGRRCNPPIGKPTVNSRLSALARLARRLRGETAAR